MAVRRTSRLHSHQTNVGKRYAVLVEPQWQQTQTDFNLTEKRANHEAKSLETLVENLVKNWEIEASHKMDVSEWRTVDPKTYTFSINGGPPQDAEHMLKVCVAFKPPPPSPPLASPRRLCHHQFACYDDCWKEKGGKGEVEQEKKVEASFASSSLTKWLTTKAIAVVLIPRS